MDRNSNTERRIRHRNESFLTTPFSEIENEKNRDIARKLERRRRANIERLEKNMEDLAKSIGSLSIGSEIGCEEEFSEGFIDQSFKSKQIENEWVLNLILYPIFLTKFQNDKNLLVYFILHLSNVADYAVNTKARISKLLETYEILLNATSDFNLYAADLLNNC